MVSMTPATTAPSSTKGFLSQVTGVIVDPSTKKPPTPAAPNPNGVTPCSAAKEAKIPRAKATH
jgi:hypothetical protein